MTKGILKSFLSYILVGGFGLLAAYVVVLRDKHNVKPKVSLAESVKDSIKIKVKKFNRGDKEYGKVLIDYCCCHKIDVLKQYSYLGYWCEPKDKRLDNIKKQTLFVINISSPIKDEGFVGVFSEVDTFKCAAYKRVYDYTLSTYLLRDSLNRVSENQMKILTQPCK